MTQRVFFFGNNRVGHRVLDWLTARGEDVVGMAIHPPDKRTHGDEILSCVDLPEEAIVDGSNVNDPETIKTIERLNPEIGVCAFFGYIIDAAILDLFPAGVVNLHPAYLPYNRGSYPNVWSIIEGTPAGATLHYLDEGIDTGDIIQRQRVPVHPTDTGKTLYHRLEDACLDLFKDAWPRVLDGRIEPRVQEEDEGTYHTVSDVEAIDRIHLDRSYQARDLIDILRARTFPPHNGAYFDTDEGRVYMELTLRFEEDT